jgi:PmbA protein
MNPQEIVDACLALGADDVVCHVGTTTKKQIRFANSAITASKLWDSVSASILVAKDQRVVATSLNDPSQLDATLDQIFKLTRVLGPNEAYRGIAKGPFTYRAVPVDTTETVEEDVIAQVFSVADECRAAGVLYNSLSSDEMATSSGAAGTDEGSAIELSVRMFADDTSSAMPSPAPDP